MNDPARRGSGLVRLGNALLTIGALPGLYGSTLILLLTIVVLVAIVGAQMGVSEIASWTSSIPLFGKQLTMTGIGELQWHLFSLLIMMSGAYALKEDRHIRVDVISIRFSRRTQLVIDVAGDLFLLLPFFALLAWYSLAFTQMSYDFAEQSNTGGLIDRYLIKAVLPIGSVLLLIAGAGRILRNLGLLLSGAYEQPSSRGTTS